ncbi:MAG: MFS transporter [Bacteroidales bacterium]|nr:MFS transporter [Bacteroidales bacterium]MDD5892048.1 MFS transporter [Bacteroidales bacterium]MDY5356507.1 MFS transporter [Candidatus Cryptobacteroides sp.]
MNKAIRFRLIVMNVIQWAVWGAYLTSMGSYLASVGLSTRIGIFYAMQGIVSIFMPTLMGIVADHKIPAQRLLGICHGIAGAAMLGAGLYGMSAGANVSFAMLFSLYSISVAFYMPTIALSNSVAYKILEQNGYDSVKAFPPIRVFGTVGFICAMLFVNFMKDGNGVAFQYSYNQFLTSGICGLAMFLYCFTLPNCPCIKEEEGGKATFAERFGLNAFKLFKDRNMATFFIFSMLLGVALQITNGFANPFITHFTQVPEFADTWGARNANALISISQVSETLGILLIPIAMKLFGIKKVMLIAMFAWVFRFGLFGAGDTGSGVWMLIISMIVYGVAFDFFNISGSLYVNMRTSEKISNSAQGLFMLMTNGIGATIGTLSAQAVVNHFVYNAETPNWSAAWYTFAAYALVVAILFIIFFKQPKNPEEKVA